MGSTIMSMPGTSQGMTKHVRVCGWIRTGVASRPSRDVIAVASVLKTKMPGARPGMKKTEVLAPVWADTE